MKLESREQKLQEYQQYLHKLGQSNDMDHKTQAEKAKLRFDELGLASLPPMDGYAAKAAFAKVESSSSNVPSIAEETDKVFKNSAALLPVLGSTASCDVANRFLSLDVTHQLLHICHDLGVKTVGLSVFADVNAGAGLKFGSGVYIGTESRRCRSITSLGVTATLNVSADVAFGITFLNEEVNHIPPFGMYEVTSFSVEIAEVAVLGVELLFLVSIDKAPEYVGFTAFAGLGVGLLPVTVSGGIEFESVAG